MEKHIIDFGIYIQRFFKTFISDKELKIAGIIHVSILEALPAELLDAAGLRAFSDEDLQKQLKNVYLKYKKKFFKIYKNEFVEVEQRHRIQIHNLNFNQIILFCNQFSTLKERYSYLLDLRTVLIINFPKFLNIININQEVLYNYYIEQLVIMAELNRRGHNISEIFQRLSYEQGLFDLITLEMQSIEKKIEMGVPDLTLKKEQDEDELNIYWTRNQTDLVEFLTFLLKSNSIKLETSKQNNRNKGIEEYYKLMFKFFNVSSNGIPYTKVVSNIKNRKKQVELNDDLKEVKHRFNLINKMTFDAEQSFTIKKLKV